MKKAVLFGLGAMSGFVGGNIFFFDKMIRSERMRNALAGVIADALNSILV